MERDASRRLGLDTTTPNVARMYHHYLGGRETFEADRAAAERAMAALPGMRAAIRENRRFLRRVVTFLAGEAGIDQFLDIGVGLPAEGPVHEVAHTINPAARVVYADYDPVVVSHGNAWLTRQDLSIVVQADLRDPQALLGLPAVREHLDFSRPIALILLAIMHFFADYDDPAAVIAALRDALVPGSYLALNHVSEDLITDKEAAKRAAAAYEQASERIWLRSRAEVLRLFDGFELVEPGLVPSHLWRPAAGRGASRAPAISWGGVGRKT